MTMSNLPASDSPIWLAWRTFLRAYKNTIDRISLDMSEAGVPTLVEYSVLHWLMRAEGNRLRQVDLSTGVLVSKSRVTRLMNDMVEKGYVTREKATDDRRVTFALLTATGRAEFERASSVFAASFDRHFAENIAPADRENLTRILSQLTAVPLGSDRPAELSISS